MNGFVRYYLTVAVISVVLCCLAVAAALDKYKRKHGIVRLVKKESFLEWFVNKIKLIVFSLIPVYRIIVTLALLFGGDALESKIDDFVKNECASVEYA